MQYNIIKQNFYFSELIKRKFFKVKSIEKKLLIAKEYGYYCWKNRTGKFSDYEVEEELIKIANKYVKRKKEEVISNEKTLHILTTALSIGGHTRLVNTWIEFLKSKQDIYLINQKNVPNFLEETLEKTNGKLYVSEKKGILEKAKELYDYSKSYKRIILHIHPDDIVPILAFGGTEIVKKIYYLNHADHTFWYGVTINKCILDLTIEGKNLSQVKRNIINSEVINIPIQNLKTKIDKSKSIVENYNLPSEAKIIFSMAGEHKYRIVDKNSKYSFYYFLEKLIPILEKLNIYFFIAGPNSEDKNWKEIILKSNSRVILLGQVCKEEIRKIWKDIDLYIDSFPINSYTCVLEALCNTRVAYSLKTPIFDMEVMKYIKVSTIEELLEKIENKFQTNEKVFYNNIENDLKNYHYEKNWVINLEKIYANNDLKGEKNYKERLSIYWDDYEIFFSESRKISLRKKIKNYIKYKI